MKQIKNKAILGLFMSAFLAVSAYAADSPEAIKQRMGSGDPVAGKEKSSLCQGCHGDSGLSMEDLIPNLAGQYANYIAKQIRNFQTGERKHQIMNAMATTVADADLMDIAAFFSSQDKMHGGGWGGNTVAINLFTKGDAGRGILACVSCHGKDGKGQAPNISIYPVIGGQHKAYLKVQLQHWRSGERANSPDGVMNKVAKNLTDEEIEALTDYLSGL